MRRQQVTDPESNYSSYEYKLFLEKRSRNELIEILMMQKDEKIPLSIFQNDMGPLEAVVKFLKEEKSLNFTEKKTKREPSIISKKSTKMFRKEISQLS